MSVQIDVQGERELSMKLDKFAKESLLAAQKGLQTGAMKIINSAKETIRRDRIIATGQLRASGRVQKVEGKEDLIDAGFFSGGSNEGYAMFVEEGRRAGKMPPPDILAGWAQKKLQLSPKEAKARGWAIARMIAKHGTQAHPFFRPAVEEHQDEITKAIESAVKAKL